MNRPQIRDHRRAPNRFRFTSKHTGSATTTWPMLAEDKYGKQHINPSIHVAAIVTKKGKKALVNNA
jgi:hypothetical protein